MTLVLAAAVKNTKSVAEGIFKAAEQSVRVITGFHAIEERVRHNEGASSCRVIYCKTGPRVRRILEECRKYSVKVEKCSDEEADKAVITLPEPLRCHRGIVLIDESGGEGSNIVDFGTWLKALPNDVESGVKNKVIALILDGITDEHNAGSIIRSADQFGVSIVVMQERRGVSGGKITESAIIARTSAGAAEWVNIAVVKNLTRAIKALKDAGFWVYRADARGERIDKVDFANRTALVMGSEGRGAARLVSENCDVTVAIPTSGRIDSLNVAVAAGVLLYEIRRQGEK